MLHATHEDEDTNDNDKNTEEPSTSKETDRMLKNKNHNKPHVNKNLQKDMVWIACNWWQNNVSCINDEYSYKIPSTSKEALI